MQLLRLRAAHFRYCYCCCCYCHLQRPVKLDQLVDRVVADERLAHK